MNASRTTNDLQAYLHTPWWAKPWLWLVLSGVVLAAWAAWQWYRLPSGERYRQQTELRTQQALEQLSGEKEVLLSLGDTLHWGNLAQAAKHWQYAHLVYRGGQLRYWTDHGLIPDEAELRGRYRYRLMQVGQSYYLVDKSRHLVGRDTLELVGLVPLYRHYKVQNRYLRSEHNPQIFGGQTPQVLDARADSSAKIHTADGQPLFAISLPEVSATQLPAPLYPVLGWALLWGVFWAVWGLWHYARLWARRGRYVQGLALLLGGGAALAVALVWSRVWPLWLGTYSPLFAGKGITLGEMGLLGVLLLLSSTYLFWYYPYITKKWLRPIRPSTRAGIYALVALVWVALLAKGYQLLLHLLAAQDIISLDITQSLRLSPLRLWAWAVFILLATSYFMLTHLSMRWLLRWGGGLKPWVLPSAWLGILLLQTALYYGQWSVGLAALWIHGLWVGLVYYLRFPKYLARFQYLSSMYLFTGAVAAAAAAMLVFYEEGQGQLLAEKRKFASQFILENDLPAETQLAQALERIEQDALLQSIYQHPFLPKSLAKQKIRRSYLGSYFDQYQAQVYVFDREGRIFGTPDADAEDNYEAFVKRYNKIWYQTDEHEQLFFVNASGVNMVRQYVAFATIKHPQGGQPVGYAVIELKQQRAISSNVYPELLLDERYGGDSPNSRQFSFAVYAADTLAYSMGDFDYKQHLPTRRLEQFYARGFIQAGYHHLVITGGNRKRIVVSSLAPGVGTFFTNFSWLFLCLVAFPVNGVIAYNVWRSMRTSRLKFATRIQFYLNLAFFLPLILVTVIILSVVSRSERRELQQSFIRNTESVSQNLMLPLENYQTGLLGREGLLSQVRQIAQYTQADINIFDPQGRLLLSTQPAIYDLGGPLSRLMQPQAYAALQTQRYKHRLQTEQVGQLRFASVYVPVYAYSTQQLLGILSIPFFESQYTSEQKLIAVFSSILSIFTAIFLVFVTLSYFASRVLTVPLRMITQKIQKTSFNDYAEPLTWHAEDEIGLLVNEYNGMLVKLEASKRALARNEKEQAWREMAKQVAHEIKNPLTPIKLTLQLLQVKLQRFEEDVQQTFDRPIETLITQVDTLTEIADSFSSFAKMPVPKAEHFDLITVLEETVQLYQSNPDIDFEPKVDTEPRFILGDRRLMGRIFTNLILNAIQAVPEGRRPHIRLRLVVVDIDLIRVEIEDNGDGVPEEIQHKIFVPNFTTKQEGSGIGLAVAKRGIEHAGGRIWFETQAGQGTCFFIELPTVDF